MRRDSVQLNVPGTDLFPTVVAYGHWGRPVLVFPSEGGSAWDYENNGMVSAVADLIDAGRVKLYCVDSLDAFTWSDRSDPVGGDGLAGMRPTRPGSGTSSLPGSTTTAADRSRSPSPAAAWARTTRCRPG